MSLSRVPRGTKLDLADIDPRSTPGWGGGKKDALPELLRLRARLAELQDVRYAQNTHRVFIMLQGMDTGGKDGRPGDPRARLRRRRTGQAALLAPARF